MRKKYRVLITGIGGPAGKAAVKYFSEHNFYILGMDMNKNVTTPVDEFREAYPANSQYYVPQLLTLAEIKNVSLVVPTVSEELPELSLNRYKFLQKGIQIYISSPNAVWVCNDKYLTLRILETMGIEIPKFTLPDGKLSNMKFPILSKPRIGRGGRGIIIYDNLEEVRKEQRSEIIFQEFIPGDDYDLNLCIDSQEPYQILASQVLQKTGLKNGIVGNASSVKRVDDPEVRQLGEKAAKALGLIGPLDIDIRKKADGQPVLLEINTRLGANCLTSREVLDALLWMWKRDNGINGKHFFSSQKS